MPDVTLRERLDADLPVLWRWLHAEPHPEWKRWDAPYFHEGAAPKSMPFDEFVRQAHARPASPDERVIAVDDAPVGLVTRSWEAPRAGGWAELGIVLYDPAAWGGGIGTRALTLWTSLTFGETDAHVLTLTTWSGNERMIRAASRVGYRECARVREARLWQGERFDSVKFDLLRGQWPTRS